MEKETRDNLELKEFLLGTIALGDAREKVEQRLMLDEEYFEDMLAIEEELIQNYADGKLSPAEKLAFEKNFLISSERREKVKFARTFRTYVNDQESPQVKYTGEKFSWAKIFSFSPGFGSYPPVLQASGAVALVVAVMFSSFLLWGLYANYSRSQMGQASLNKAQKDGRPLEWRISGIDYAPYNRQRGSNAERDNDLELKSAERQFEDNALGNRTAANLLSLGRVKLAKKDFQQAIEYLEEAERLDPKNARILSDLGVAYLEKGRLQEDDAGRVELYVKASKKIDEALEQDPNLLEARFNKARYLEAVGLVNAAREAWQDYLNLDGTSGWAEEAARHLQELKPAEKDVTDDQMKRDFLDLASNQRDDEAFDLVSQNRELIEKKYLPQKLAMSMLEADDGQKKAESYQGLVYLGELESARIEDRFAADLAVFYSDLSPEKRETLKKAQLAMQEGYRLCKSNEFEQATREFTTAQTHFRQAEDVIEEKTISAYFIAYSMFNNRRVKEAAERFKEVDEFSRPRKYEWFTLMNLDWVIGSENALGYLLSSDVKDRRQAGLKRAEDMRDLYLEQKFVESLALANSLVKQDEKNFPYLQKIFEYCQKSYVSSRQKGRGLNLAVRVLASGHYNGMAQAAVRESIAYNATETDPSFVIKPRTNAGNIYIQTRNFPEAEKWLLEAKKGAESLAAEGTRQKTLGEITLSLGNLERERNNYDRAIAYYDESLRLQGEDNVSPRSYEIKKSRMLAYQALGDDERIEKDLPDIMSYVENKRKQINNEADRSSFFSYQQDVYDISIEHKFRQGNAGQAFDYAETSNSRSLLDWLQRGLKTSGDKGKVESPDPASPLTMNEIRERMPAGVQILQYAVLKNRVLIWVISKDKVVLIPSEIKSSVLEAKVEDYVERIKEANAAEQEEASKISRELYAVLIEPALSYLDPRLELCIVPNKSLFYLPYAALLSPGGKYFVQEFAFFYSPSANVFIVATDEARKRSSAVNESLLSVGNPDFDKKKLSKLEDLEESAREAGEIARNYPPLPQILLGKEATKSAFQRALKNADVIHFAGHYVVNPNKPLLSELVMAKNSVKEEDSFFTNAELKNEQLPRTKLVVLSACQTGVEGYYNGEGLVGLSRTFLSLGVPLVVASQWSVNTDATAQLMKKFHYYRKQENLSTLNALRKAQLEMVDAPNSQFRAPYYWAAFAAFGGHAEF